MTDLIKKARAKVVTIEAALKYAEALLAADEVIKRYRERLSFPNSARTADNLHNALAKYRALIGDKP